MIAPIPYALQFCMVHFAQADVTTKRGKKKSMFSICNKVPSSINLERVGSPVRGMRDERRTHDGV